MPSLLPELDQWSFKGVPFLVKSTRTSGGRKTATHEFVDSSKRVVEDLGLLQKTFSLEAIIDNADGQYFLKRNALINALEEGGAGVLIHAFFGKLNVVAKPYTLREKIDELGAAFFDLTFERADDIIAPLPDAFTRSNIAELQVVALDNVAADIENNLGVSNAFPFNFTAVSNLLEGVGNQFDSITQTFDRALDEINNFAATLTNFRNNILRLVNLPAQMSATLKNLYNSAVALAQTPEEAFLTLEKNFTFGDDFDAINPTTFERIERLRNQELLTVFMQAGALAFAYERTSAIDFFTIREIDLYAQKLNAQYNKVIPSITNNDTAKSFQDLRSVTNEFLDIQRLNVKKIVDFDTQSIPAQVLAYKLYGSVDDYEKLVELNSIKDVDFVSGPIEVFR